MPSGALAVLTSPIFNAIRRIVSSAARWGFDGSDGIKNIIVRWLPVIRWVYRSQMTGGHWRILVDSNGDSQPGAAASGRASALAANAGDGRTASSWEAIWGFAGRWRGACAPVPIAVVA